MSAFSRAESCSLPPSAGPALAGSPPQWRRTLAVVVAGICSFIELYSTQTLLPLLRQVFHATELQVSQTVGATTLAVAIASPFIGLLADAIGRKGVIVAAILGLSVPTFLAGFAASLHQLIVWRFVQGLFLPGVFAITIAYINEESEPGRVGSIMAVYVSGTVVGGFMGRFISGLVAAHLDWRWAFVILGGITLAGGLVTWALLPPARHFCRQTDAMASLRAIGAHLRNSRLLATYAVGFNVLFSLVGTFTYVNFYLAAKPFELGSAALGSVFFVYTLGIVVTPLGGRWIDRAGYRKVLAAAVMASAAGVLLTLVRQLPAVIAGLAICSSGVFVCQSAASSHIGAAAQEAKSSAAGLYVALYYAGGSVATVLLGLFWRWGGWPACVFVVVIVQVLTAAMALAFWAEGDEQAAAAISVSGG